MNTSNAVPTPETTHHPEYTEEDMKVRYRAVRGMLSVIFTLPQADQRMLVDALQVLTSIPTEADEHVQRASLKEAHARTTLWGEILANLRIVMEPEKQKDPSFLLTMLMEVVFRPKDVMAALGLELPNAKP